jgi:hypothetical protein
MGPQSHVHGIDMNSRKGVCFNSNQNRRSSIGSWFGLPKQLLVFNLRLWRAWYLFNAGGVCEFGGSTLLARQQPTFPKNGVKPILWDSYSIRPLYRTVNTRSDLTILSRKNDWILLGSHQWNRVLTRNYWSPSCEEFVGKDLGPYWQILNKKRIRYPGNNLEGNEMNQATGSYITAFTRNHFMRSIEKWNKEEWRYEIA